MLSPEGLQMIEFLIGIYLKSISSSESMIS